MKPLLELAFKLLMPYLMIEIVKVFRKLESDSNFKRRSYEVLDQHEKAVTPNDDFEAKRAASRLWTDLKQR